MGTRGWGVLEEVMVVGKSFRNYVSVVTMGVLIIIYTILFYIT